MCGTMETLVDKETWVRPCILGNQNTRSQTVNNVDGHRAERAKERWMDKDREIRAGEGVIVETDFTLHDPGGGTVSGRVTHQGL